MGDALQAVHDDIAADHPSVVHVDGAALAALPPADVLLFDARDVEEYGVSHLPGAIRVDPDVEPEAFLARYGAEVEGRVVVFYCSVGRRSSIVAERLQAALFERGAAGVANLEGGIFEWRNTERPLVDAVGTTRFVHPYDRWWGRYVEDEAALRYTPRTSGEREEDDE
jgi:rhodanese-related sulfurtransferase